jgi:type II secretory pathway pseudopilin PulG
VELVIVVTIIGIISAIAVPRMSSAATGASASALEASISSVRGAIDAYYAEHGSYPGYVPGLGSADGTWFVDQLVMYTNKQGQTSASRTGAYLFGPYLRKPFPKNPCNQLADVHVKANPAAADPANGSVGWVAVLSTGDFGISATDTALDDIGLVQPEKKLDVRLR